MNIKKRSPKELEDLNDDRWILFAIKYPNPECCKVTVGYYKDKSFYSFLDNELYFDDGHIPKEIPLRFIEWWAEMPKFQLLKEGS